VKAEFTEYLKSVGIETQPALARAERALKAFSLICPEEIKDIFVEEYVKEEGSREYESLEGFSANYWCSAVRFLTDDRWNISSTRKRIRAVNVRGSEYEFGDTTEKSRLSIFIAFSDNPDQSGTLKASGKNCDALRQIFIKYIQPNFLFPA